MNHYKENAQPFSALPSYICSPVCIINNIYTEFDLLLSKFQYFKALSRQAFQNVLLFLEVEIQFMDHKHLKLAFCSHVFVFSSFEM